MHVSLTLCSTCKLAVRREVEKAEEGATAAPAPPAEEPAAEEPAPVVEESPAPEPEEKVHLPEAATLMPDSSRVAKASLRAGAPQWRCWRDALPVRKHAPSSRQGSAVTIPDITTRFGADCCSAVDSGEF